MDQLDGRQAALDLPEVLFSVEQAREALFAPADAAGAADGSGEVAELSDQGETASEETADAPGEGASDEGKTFDEGNVGLGVDIVEIARMKAILERSPHFAERVFSPAEREYCTGMASPATHYAMRFAAKEAVVKALGTGFAQGIDVRDIEVGRYASGKPHAILSGRAREVAEERGVRDLEISLSYTHDEAVACALAVTESSLRASEKRVDPMEELARQFKETRGMLDEL